MNHATETDTVSARRALLCSLASLDKGHDAAALAWAETAEIILQECRLVAPHDKPKLGDYVAGVISVAAVTWFVVHSLWSVL